MKKSRIAYACKIDFDWELGEALGGSVLYPSIEDLKEHHSCVEDCGIVKVKVSLEEVISDGKPWGKE